MNEEYTVVDNFLPDYDFDPLRAIFEDEDTTPWFYRNRQASVAENEEKDSPYFYHVLYVQQRPNSPLWDSVEQLFMKHLKPNALINVRANLVVNTNSGWNNKHRDMYTPDLSHKVSILYLNDCNGKTVLCLPDGDVEIESKANRLLTFPATIQHYGIHQTDTDRRILLNVNYY